MNFQYFNDAANFGLENLSERLSSSSENLDENDGLQTPPLCPVPSGSPNNFGGTMQAYSEPNKDSVEGYDKKVR